ncbi:MAG TPA: hypothetical protein ENN11_05770 [Methanomicrobia archaeon]|nr:hypothetical protein [Methanomicrobia archaeon]
MVQAAVLLKLVDAKSRLAPFLSLAQRQTLVLYMLSHVLNVLEDMHTPILTRSFYTLGTHSDEENINECIEVMRRSVDEDLVVVTSDLPFFSKEALQALTSEPDTLAIGPSHNGGTSGLFIPRSIDFTPLFGRGSLERHRLQSVEKGHTMRLVDMPAFRDVDIWEDVEWIFENAPSSAIGRFLSGLVKRPITAF